MYNWTIDEKKLKENDPDKYELWKLVQLINYGLDDRKLSKKQLIKCGPLSKIN